MFRVEYLEDYLWLLNTIYSAGRLSREQIDERWRNSPFNIRKTNEYGARRLSRSRNYILRIFGIDIRCDRTGGNLYYIANLDEVKKDVIRKWMLNSFAVNTILQDMEPLHNRILFEDIPSGQLYLMTILEAMKSNRVMEMSYQGFKRPEPHTFKVAPYCLKVFKQRWYMVGQADIYDQPRTYSLDRVHSVTILDEPFTLPADFHADEYFHGYFGVITEGEPQVIRIRVDAMTANYLRTLPIHESQREVEKQTEHSIFEYYLAPTFDFIQELRQQGSNLEVLAPSDLRQAFKKEAENEAFLYK